MKRIDTCWFCGKEKVECIVTVLKSGKEITCCDTCDKVLKEDAEYIDPNDYI